MELGLKVPLLYTAASLLSSSSSIVFVFSASLELRRHRFASPATPDATCFLTGGHPEARPPCRSSPDAAPLTEEPPAAPDAARAPRRRRFRFPGPPRPDAAPSSSPEGILTPTHTSPE